MGDWFYYPEDMKNPFGYIVTALILWSILLGLIADSIGFYALFR